MLKPLPISPEMGIGNIGVYKRGNVCWFIKHMFSKAVDWNMAEEETLKRIRRMKLLPENKKRIVR